MKEKPGETQRQRTRERDRYLEYFLVSGFPNFFRVSPDAFEKSSLQAKNPVPLLVRGSTCPRAR
jgi:hypothetical protein